MSKYYRQPKYGMIYGHEMITPIVRCVWPALVKPKDPPPPKEGEEPGKPRYEITLLMDKEDPECQSFKEDICSMVHELCAEFNLDPSTGKPKKVQMSFADEPFNDGDELDKEKYQFAHGHGLLVARNSKGIACLGADGAPVDKDFIKGGMKVRCLITPHFGTYGLAFRFDGVQFAEDDGVKIGGSIREASAFLTALTPKKDIYGEVKSPMDPRNTPANVSAPLAAMKVTTTQQGKKAALNRL